MLRQPPPPNPKLEALRDERDHLNVQISLLDSGDEPDSDEMATMINRVADLDKRIARLERRHPDPS